MRKLIIYPNCSKGGVTSVIRGRARREEGTQFDVVFFNDRGGRSAFRDLPNVNVRLVRGDRSRAYLTHLLSLQKYDSVSVLSHPATANHLSAHDDLALTYEFHSSDMGVIQKEIDALELDRIARIAAPSQVMVDLIRQHLPARIRGRVGVDVNLVDAEVFTVDGPAGFWEDSRFRDPAGSVPLVWVGRFDKGKGYRYFVRLIAQLPQKYVGHVIVSLEDDPARAEAFLSECDSMGVADRMRLYLNLSQQQVSRAFRSARDLGGWLVSTSLLESFGYSVAEATACGLRVAAFDLPVWDLYEQDDLVGTVSPGSVHELAELIGGGNGSKVSSGR